MGSFVSFPVSFTLFSSALELRSRDDMSLGKDTGTIRNYPSSKCLLIHFRIHSFVFVSLCPGRTFVDVSETFQYFYVFIGLLCATDTRIKNFIRKKKITFLSHDMHL